MYMIVNLCEIFQLKENTHYHRRHTSKVMAHPIHSVCNESESASYYSLRGRSFIRIPLKYYASITQKFNGIQDIAILKYFEIFQNYIIYDRAIFCRVTKTYPSHFPKQLLCRTPPGCPFWLLPTFVLILSHTLNIDGILVLTFIRNLQKMRISTFPGWRRADIFCFF